MRKVFILLIVVSMVFSQVALLNGPMHTVASSKVISTEIHGSTSKAYVLRRISDKIIVMSVEPGRVESQQFKGLWWNPDWEYRINVTVSEPGVVNRTNWPVDVFIMFDPPAFKYSIRVIRVDGNSFTEIPSQIWNVTYYNETHLSSATITFLVTMAKGESQLHQIYWSTDYTDPPSYTKRFSVTVVETENGDKYIITHLIRGWSVELPPIRGGKLMNITLPNGDTIGHTWTHFGVTRNINFSYEGYWGTGDTNNVMYSSRYILERTDTLLSIYEGVIFITYVVEEVPLYDTALGGVIVAEVNYTYRFFDWGIVALEGVKWVMDDNYAVDYYTAGWVFDQDDADDCTFNRVYAGEEIIEMPLARYSTQNGTISESWDYYRIFDPSKNLPLVAIFRVYMDAGTHHILVRTAGDDYIGAGTWRNDDPYFRVADPSGNWLQLSEGDYGSLFDNNFAVWGDGAYYGGVDAYVTTTTSGYHYILVGVIDDDNGDLDMDFVVEVDGNVIGSGKIFAYNTPNDLSYAIPRGAMQLLDFTPSVDLVGIRHRLDVDWLPTDHDLDVIVFEDDGDVLNYSISGLQPPETVLFTPTVSKPHTIFIVRYSGTGTTTLTADVIAMIGAEFEDFYNESSLWDSIAFYHSNFSRGIGFVLIGEHESGISYNEKTIIYYNDGNDSEVDYIYWARRIKGIMAPNGSIYKVGYGVVLWSPTGIADNERLHEFNVTYYGLKNVVSVSKAKIEKYLLSVTVRVTDDDGDPIYGAKVSLIRTFDQAVLYNGTTDKSGQAKFEAIRYNYTINVTLTSGGKTYVNDTVEVDYELYNYTIHSDEVVIVFKNLVRFRMCAYTNTTPKQIIQGGLVVLADPLNKANRSISYTNLTGWVDIYIMKGSWELAFNATVTSPERWDNITVYSDPQLKNLVAGPDVNVTLSIIDDVIYYLEDLDITEAPVQTKLILFETLTSYEVYWMEIISIKVNLTRTDTGENIDGTVYWYVFDPSGNVALYGTASSIALGSFQFDVNTTLLTAGQSYSIQINATPIDPLPDGKHPLSPAPITILLIVDKRPMNMDVSLSPGNEIYWNESLTITVTLKDALSGSPLENATVNVTIYSSTIITKTLNLVGNGIYEIVLKTELASLDTGSYLMVITVAKDNYESGEKSITLTIDERPTSYTAPSYIETPWVDSYSIYISYIDSIYNSLIRDADAKYNFSDALTGTILQHGNLTYTDGRYLLWLNLTNVVEKTYTITVFLGKKNYMNITLTITFEIRARDTSVVPDTTKLTLIYGEYIVVRINYYDEDFGEYVAGANTSYSITMVGYEAAPILGSLNDLRNGTYILNVSTVRIGALGTAVAYVEFRKSHYEYQSLSITIIVEPIPTEVYSSVASISLEWGLNISVLFWFNRTDTDLGIADPDNASFKLYYNQTLILSGNLTNLGDGRFLLKLNTTAFINNTQPNLGTYKLEIFFEKSFYENRTIIIPVTVDAVSTLSYAQPSNVSIIWGEMYSVTVYYNKTRDKKFIYGALPTITIFNESGYIVSVPEGAFNLVVGDTYMLIINSSLLDTMLYIVEITLSKTFYDTGTVRIFVDVAPIPTYVALSQKKAELEYDEHVTIYVWYNYYETDEPVVGADAVYSVCFGENLIVSGKMTYDASNKYYYFVLNATYIIDLMAQTYSLEFPVVLTVYITVNKEHHVSQDDVITLTIYEIACYVKLAQTEITAEWGELVPIRIEIIRNKTNEFVGDVELSVGGLPEGSYTANRTDYGWLLIVDTYTLEVKSYHVVLAFSKPYHSIGSKELTLMVTEVHIAIDLVETPPNYVEKIQFISEDIRTKIRVLITHNKTPVEDAEVVVIVSSTDAGVNKTYVAQKVPPVYEATIYWREFPPGYNWTVTIKILSVTIYGRMIPADKIVFTEKAYYIAMDYMSGSTKIPGTNIYIANMYFYPLVAILTIAIAYGGYKAISWWTLPWEVKEIIRLLKRLEKGVFEYRAPERKQYMVEMIQQELALK